MWKTLAGIRIPDILQFVADASRAGQAVHIGTDSLQTRRFTQFVTVVVILTPQKGDAWRTGGRPCRGSPPSVSGC